MQPVIRKAEIKDAKDIADILHCLGWFANVNKEPSETTRDRVIRHLELCHADNSHSVYAAELETNRVLGYASVHWNPYLFLPGPEGYVSELFVHPDFQNQGIGTALLEKIKQEGRQRGCSRLMLINNRTRQSYEQGFYSKNGWEERLQMSNFIFSLKEK